MERVLESRGAQILKERAPAALFSRRATSAFNASSLIAEGAGAKPDRRCIASASPEFPLTLGSPASCVPRRDARSGVSLIARIIRSKPAADVSMAAAPITQRRGDVASAHHVRIRSADAASVLGSRTDGMSISRSTPCSTCCENSEGKVSRGRVCNSRES